MVLHLKLNEIKRNERIKDFALSLIDYSANVKASYFHVRIDLANVNNLKICDASLPNGGGAERMRGGEGQTFAT